MARNVTIYRKSRTKNSPVTANQKNGSTSVLLITRLQKERYVTFFLHELRSWNDPLLESLVRPLCCQMVQNSVDDVA